MHDCTTMGLHSHVALSHCAFSRISTSLVDFHTIRSTFRSQRWVRFHFNRWIEKQIGSVTAVCVRYWTHLPHTELPLVSEHCHFKYKFIFYSCTECAVKATKGRSCLPSQRHFQSLVSACHYQTLDWVQVPQFEDCRHEGPKSTSSTSQAKEHNIGKNLRCARFCLRLTVCYSETKFILSRNSPGYYKRDSIHPTSPLAVERVAKLAFLHCANSFI